VVKINNNPSNNIAKLYQTQQIRTDNKEIKSGSDPVESDNLQLSEQARQIHELIKETRDLPEVREEKIARIREQISNNTYNISPSQVAAKMLAGEDD